MTMVTRGFTTFLDRLSTAAKAVLAAAVIGLPEFPTLVTGLVAWIGVGDMPPEPELQRAIVQVFMAFFGGMIVYQIPNSTGEEVAEKKLEDDVPVIPQAEAELELVDVDVN